MISVGLLEVLVASTGSWLYVPKASGMNGPLGDLLAHVAQALPRITPLRFVHPSRKEEAEEQVPDMLKRVNQIPAGDSRLRVLKGPFIAMNNALDPKIILPLCNWEGCPGGRCGVQKCGGCKSVYYCSKPCQTAYVRSSFSAPSSLICRSKSQRLETWRS